MSAYIFYGKAGSGKGTQAKLLQTHLESQGRTVIYIETGSMFRTLAATDSFAAKCTAEIIDAGALMPVFLPVYMWSDELIRKYTGNEDIIFDGVARRPDEGRTLDSALDFFKIADRSVFHIHITDESAIDRLQIRNQGRADDADVSKIQNRLEWYRENVLPTIAFFQGNENYSFAEINGELDVDGVWRQIQEQL